MRMNGSALLLAKGMEGVEECTILRIIRKPNTEIYSVVRELVKPVK
jgi:hypothetical protein